MQAKVQDFRKMIAFCGLYCRECPAFIKEISFLANELRNELDNYKSERLAHELSVIEEEFHGFGDYKEFYNVLRNLEKLNCNLICREGGGASDCSIRICCTQKGFEGCWECKELENCEKLVGSQPVCGKNNLGDLKTIRDHGIEGFIEQKES